MGRIRAVLRRSPAAPTACPACLIFSRQAGPSEGRCVSRVQTRIIPLKCFTSSTAIDLVDRLVVLHAPAPLNVSPDNILQPRCRMSRFGVEAAAELHDTSRARPGRPELPAIASHPPWGIAQNLPDKAGSNRPRTAAMIHAPKRRRSASGAHTLMHP